MSYDTFKNDMCTTFYGTPGSSDITVINANEGNSALVVFDGPVTRECVFYR